MENEVKKNESFIKRRSSYLPTVSDSQNLRSQPIDMFLQVSLFHIIHTYIPVPR